MYLVRGPRCGKWVENIAWGEASDHDTARWYRAPEIILNNDSGGGNGRSLGIKKGAENWSAGRWWWTLEGGLIFWLLCLCGGLNKWNKKSTQTHRIHGTGMFTYIYHKFRWNVGRYTIHGSYGKFKKLSLKSFPEFLR